MPVDPSVIIGVHWDSLVQGTITGLVGAAVLAAIIGSRNWIRSQIQKLRIKRELNGMSIGSGVTGITTSIHNETEREMVVRQVAFFIGKAYIVLLPSGELTSAFKEKSRKLTRAEMRRVRKGEMIQLEAEMQFASWKVPPSAGGFVPLPPYTKTSFILPAQFLADSDHSIESFRVVLEYVTRTGAKKILQHDVKPRFAHHIQKTLDHFQTELRDGTLNAARRKFGMTEVVSKKRPINP